MSELRGLAKTERKRWRSIPVDQADKGDVTDLSIPGRDFHVGVFMNSNIIGHLERDAFPIIARKTSIRIRNRIRGVYRYDG